MRKSILAATALAMTVAGAQEDLRAPPEQTYDAWRQTVARKDARTWERVTASHRKTEIRNRIVSIQGVQPVKAFEDRVEEGGAVKPSGTSHFDVNAAIVNKFMGRAG